MDIFDGEDLEGLVKWKVIDFFIDLKPTARAYCFV